MDEVSISPLAEKRPRLSSEIIPPAVEIDKAWLNSVDCSITKYKKPRCTQKLDPKKESEDHDDESLKYESQECSEDTDGNTTLPEELCILETDRNDGGGPSKGVWSINFLKKDTVFYTLDGSIVLNENPVAISRSNWMSSVRKSSNPVECNTQFNRSGRSLFMKTLVDIQPFTELVHQIIEKVSTVSHFPKRQNLVILKQFKCTNCNHVFDSENCLKDHIRDGLNCLSNGNQKHIVMAALKRKLQQKLNSSSANRISGDGFGKFMCNKCDIIFHSLEDIANHCQKNHTKVPTPSNPPWPKTLPKGKETETDKSSSSNADQDTDSVTDIKDIDLQSNVIAGPPSNTSTNQRNIETVQNTTHTCTEKINSNVELKTNIKDNQHVHSKQNQARSNKGKPEKTSRPSQPSQSSTDQGNKKKAKNSTDPEIRVFDCASCEETFDSVEKLKSHRLTAHVQRLNACIICGKDFDKTNPLRLGTLAKPYVCLGCQLKPADKYLKKVEDIHKRRITCADCSLTFRCMSDLKAHSRTHTGEKPHLCSDCGVGFALLSTLRDHERIHTGEKPHKCEECGKGFAQKSALTKHRRTHTNRSHNCEQCGNFFYQLKSLAKHKLNQHSKKSNECENCGMKFSRQAKVRICKVCVS